MIELLPKEVIDQIAAGEVVERPAHMIKEIIENSIDAGATRVDIEYSEGGRCVSVTDNGRGISKEELPKALERFATSKITEADDLWKLKTFGFRGEALASISAVCDFKIISRTINNSSAFQLHSQFGDKNPVDSVGGEFGTTIVIEKLFENTPARLKFLKSAASEHSLIRTTLKAVAMAHPQVEFRIKEDGKLIFYWAQSESRKKRVEQIFEIQPMYEGEASRENVRAYVVYADPHHVSKTSKNIWLFAQNRWIQDRGMLAATMEAYRHLLMHGEYPVAAVWIDTDTEFIDVNIHPTKSQVKFQEPSLVFRAVQGALRDSIEKAPWVPKKNVSTETFVMPENLKFTSSEFERTQFPQKQMIMEPVKTSYQTFSEQPSVSYQDLKNSQLDREKLFSEKDQTNGYWSSLQIIGQIDLTYIVCQARDRIVFVDQHAAHERIFFEKLMNAWRGGKIDIQEFLFPLAIDLSPEKVEALRSYFGEVQRLGILIEELGPSTIGVKAAPPQIKESVYAEVLDKMALEIMEYGGSYSIEKMISERVATMACHSAVRAGQALSMEQMKQLLIEMDEFPLSSFCPHGRPVSVEYLFSKLEKDFGRTI